MAYILIDGYNLIGTAHKDLEKARNELIEKISEYSKIRRHNITVVFDGWKEGKPEETVTWTGGVMVIYSRLAEKADSVIMRIISKEKKPWIVVSSDREIADFASRHNLVPIRSDEFEERLYGVLQDHKWQNAETLEYNYDEEDYNSPRRKGSSRRLSKREKRRLQTLKKL